MTDNVVPIGCMTTLSIPVERVLEGALKNHETDPFRRVLVIGYTESGEEYHASSEGDGGQILWDMERCRHMLMRRADDD